MKQILRVRGHGKTADAIRTCIEENAVLVTPYSLSYIDEMSYELYDTHIRVVHIRDFINGRLVGCHDEKFVIDDAEVCLKYLIGCNELTALTMNIE